MRNAQQQVPEVVDSDVLGYGQMGSVALISDSNNWGWKPQRTEGPSKVLQSLGKEDRSLPQPRVQEKLVMGSDQRSILLNTGLVSFFPAARKKKKKNSEKKKDEKRARLVIQNRSPCHEQFAIQELYQSELFQQTQWNFLPQNYSLFQL